MSSGGDDLEVGGQAVGRSDGGGKDGSSLGFGDERGPLHGRGRVVRRTVVTEMKWAGVAISGCDPSPFLLEMLL